MAVCPECQVKLDSMHVSGCWACGAGFSSGSNWKPISSSTVDLIEYSLTSALRSIALFTAPVWGIVLTVLLLSIVAPRGGSLLLFVGVWLPFAFMPRIWDADSLGWVGKLFASVIYYAVSCIAMYIAGWATLLIAYGQG